MLFSKNAPVSQERFAEFAAQEQRQRLYLLDILRGFASVGVVLWHYQGFYFVSPGKLPAAFDPSVQPFYWLFGVFYTQGWRMVELFFVLSGFVFYHQYHDKVKANEVSASRFFVLRFSRLYPLHFLTLILVAIGQIMAFGATGEYIIYSCNDPARFMLNALFVSEWVPASFRCWSFNGPIWSVSVEVFIYIIFFIFAKNLPDGTWKRLLVTGVLITIGAIVFRLGGFHLIGEPLMCFFSGVLACQVWTLIKRENISIEKAIAALIVFMVALVAYQFFRGINSLIIGLLLFPSFVLVLALIQTSFYKAGTRVKIIGDITYATYLMHFPLQLLVIFCAKTNNINIDYSNNLIFLAFFAVLFIICVPTYYLFELPMQRILRRWLSPRKSSAEPALRAATQ
jgi:peptidoglycan/LPS O-acetylase OafA/YrhL